MREIQRKYESTKSVAGDIYRFLQHYIFESAEKFKDQANAFYWLLAGASYYWIHTRIQSNRLRNSTPCFSVRTFDDWVFSVRKKYA